MSTIKTIKISEFEFNVNCPYCSEYIDTADDYFTPGEIVICPRCKQKSKIIDVDSITDMELF